MSETGLLVLSDDWGRHPTSCQHLVRQVLPRHRVLWTNVIGMRRPAFDMMTLRRGWDKLRQWTRPRRQALDLPPGLEVVSPVLWPSFRSRFVRRLNRKLLCAKLQPLLEKMPAPPVAVTTQPTMVEVVDHLPVRRWVYYCVDDFTQWPGLDHQTLQELEERLIDRADCVIAASETLRDQIRRRGRDAALLTHGVDLAFWRQATEPLASVDGLRRPLIVFWGLVDRRLDLAFLEKLGTALAHGTVLLLGLQGDYDPAVTRLPGVMLHPPVPFADLPALAQATDVLIMPYADRPVTRAMQPLKLKEYLATGKPVVVRDLPAVRPWRDCLDAAATPEAFCRCVQMRLASGLPEDQARARQRLAEESWLAKAAQFERLLFEAPGLRAAGFVPAVRCRAATNPAARCSPE